MARGGRLPRAAGRPPRFLRTGPSARYQPERGTSIRPRGGTPDTRSREAEGVRQSLLFHRASQGLRAQRRHSASWPRATRRRRGARFRGGLLAAAEVADAAPATALRPKGPCRARGWVAAQIVRKGQSAGWTAWWLLWWRAEERRPWRRASAIRPEHKALDWRRGGCSPRNGGPRQVDQPFAGRRASTRRGSNSVRAAIPAEVSSPAS